jgi:hypothetical protein
MPRGLIPAAWRASRCRRRASFSFFPAPINTLRSLWMDEGQAAPRPATLPTLPAYRKASLLLASDIKAI